MLLNAFRASCCSRERGSSHLQPSGGLERRSSLKWKTDFAANSFRRDRRAERGGGPSATSRRLLGNSEAAWKQLGGNFRGSLTLARSRKVSAWLGGWKPCGCPECVQQAGQTAVDPDPAAASSRSGGRRTDGRTAERRRFVRQKRLLAQSGRGSIAAAGKSISIASAGQFLRSPLRLAVAVRRRCGGQRCD